MSIASHCTPSTDMLVISPDITALIGDCAGLRVGNPTNVAVLTFSLGDFDAPAAIGICTAMPGEEAPGMGPDAVSVSLIVSVTALQRLFDWHPAGDDGIRYHLTSSLRAIALAVRDCTPGPAQAAYRSAKCVELLCETAQFMAAGGLIPIAGDGAMSLADSRRLVDARRMIDERWAEKLTLDGVARACGINRAKLTRGFRKLYRCSVAEALAERRLTEACHRLLSTDLPVGTIGYDSGYLNNASFARAFGRRFGVSPSEYRGRRQRLAA